MTGAEQGFLLLTGWLGDPERRPLTVAQFRELTRRARLMDKPVQDRDLTESDLKAMGCDEAFSRRVLKLLSQQEQLAWYLEKGNQEGCIPITRYDENYPDRVRKGLALEAPGSLWAKGDLALLEKPCISLVGSRDLCPQNRNFARELGKQAALQGYTLVSGNARGADRTAQDSCLAHGGTVISVVADALGKCEEAQHVLYLSEHGFDLPFTSQRALSRNRIIHCLSPKTFVAQCSLEKGGTWDGTCKNLQQGWSTVFCFYDGSQAIRELTQRGGIPVGTDSLQNLDRLRSNILSYME